MTVDWMYALEYSMLVAYVWGCFKLDTFLRNLYWGELVESNDSRS